MLIQRAKEQLQTARGIYRCGPEAVCKNVQDFYFEMVDLLLQQASWSNKMDERNHLAEVIKNIDSFRKTELLIDLNPYPCPEQQPESPCSKLPEGTAVLYPIVLNDRMELLLVSKNGIQRFTVPV